MSWSEATRRRVVCTQTAYRFAAEAEAERFERRPCLAIECRCGRIIASLRHGTALAVASIGKQVGLVRVDKSVAYLDIDDTGLAEAGYGPVTP